MAEDIMAGGTYGKEKQLQDQVAQGGVDITPEQTQATQQFVAPPLQQIDAFSQATERASEPTATGTETMGLIQMSGKEALLAAYNAYPSEAILQLYNSLEQ